MATLVQHLAKRETANQATNVLTVTSTGAGNLLVMLTHHALTTTTVSGVSDGTTAFTQFAGAALTGPSSNGRLECWYLLSSNSGKTTMTTTFSTTDTFNKDVWFFEVSGLTSPATDGSNGNATVTASGFVMTGTAVTTTSTSGFVLGLMVPNNNVVLNPNTGNEFTSGGDNLNGNGSVSLLSTTAASHTPEWTTDTSGDTPNTTITVAFKGTVSTDTQEWLTRSAAQQGPRVRNVMY